MIHLATTVPAANLLRPPAPPSIDVKRGLVQKYPLPHSVSLGLNKLPHRQASTDHRDARRRLYVEAVDEAFGATADFAQIIKTYGRPEGVDEERR